MVFDYKKQYKEFYLPKNKPEIVKIPKMNFIAVRGKGNPNDINGEYKDALRILYSIAFTIKMSYKNNYNIKGYFAYKVPPLEGLWWQEGIEGVDYSNKETFNWISMIRLPDFVTKKDFDWAINNATIKKKQNFSKAEFFVLKEGLCVQCMHKGSYDNEPETIEIMNEFLKENGYENDFSNSRYHHEIYYGDPRRGNPKNLKTVIRHPIKKSSK